MTERINFSNLIESTKDPRAPRRTRTRLGTLFVGAADDRRKRIRNISVPQDAFVFHCHRQDSAAVTNDTSLPPVEEQSESSVLRPGESVELDVPSWLNGASNVVVLIEDAG
jgi:hypothetical protein